MRTLFKGGTVITGRGPKRADVLVEGEKVRQVGRLILTPADRTVDVEGCLLFPGFIDAHTHFDLDVCNTTTADDFTTGSRAALKGGTTTVIDFACPNKGESLQYGLELWHKKADGRTFCDYGFHMTIDDWNESIRAELLKQAKEREMSSDGVILSTMHSSKGLEYRIVFIIDANEGITPHKRVLFEEDMEEERRLFYVAMTRAKELLYIFSVRKLYGKKAEQSRFVEELLEE